jgi:hypothetical protein
MAADPDTHLFSPKRIVELRQRARDQITRSQWLTGVACTAQARAASLCTESATLLDEMRFRQTTRR